MAVNHSTINRRVLKYAPQLEAAERFFRRVLQASHARAPRAITVDKNTAYPPAFEPLQHEGMLPAPYVRRQCMYLSNAVEQDQRFVKRRVNPGLGFGAFHTAQRTIQGYEAMYMIRRGNHGGIAKRDALAQRCVINRRFGLAA